MKDRVPSCVCEGGVQAGQYQTVKNLESFDEFLAKAIPGIEKESRIT